MSRALRISPKLEAFRHALHVRRETRKGLAAQLAEIVRLRFGPSQLGAGDYYTYGVYDDESYSAADKTHIGGWRLRQRLVRLLNDPAWSAVVEDKLTCYAFLGGLGIETPRSLALYHPQARTYGTVPCLRTGLDVAAFLRDEAEYPFFGKPIDLAHGWGTSSVNSIDRNEDRLYLSNGRSMGVEEYVQTTVLKRTQGYLFQERIRQHPEVERICGTAVASLRVVVLNYDTGPQIFRVGWRIPTGKNFTDNFDEGRSGNLRSWVDRRTGRVERVVRGTRHEQGEKAGLGALGEEVETHPNTGARIRGQRVPEWDQVVEVCLRAAAALPGLRLQGWDIACGRNGPVVLEVNRDIGLPQMPGSPGVFDDELRAFVNAYGREYVGTA